MTGQPQNDARHVTYCALPPLWTRREPAVRLVASHLRVLLGPRDKAESQAVLVATHGVRAPVQFVHQTTSPLPDPCCAEAASGGRPARADRPREPAPYDMICTHRPWGEVGLVENYRSLGEAAGCSADTARKRLTRYQGPWPELLWP